MSVEVKEEQKNDLSVLVTVGKVAAGINEKGEHTEAKTLVGFGKIEPNEYNQNEVGGRETLYKMSTVSSFLKSVDANQIGMTLKGQDKDGEAKYMKASSYLQQGIAKSGAPYKFNKIKIELEPAVTKTDEKTGEVITITPAQNLYATKYGNKGYEFDLPEKNSELIDKFNKIIKNGVEFSLSANKDKTLENYPKLNETLKQIDKSAIANIEFVKGEGAILKSLTPLDKDGKTTGEDKLVNKATKKATKSKAEDLSK